jgi:uncharacterized delta-60 repeat protein
MFVAMPWQSVGAVLIVAVGLAVSATPAAGTPGDLDPSFSRNGFTRLGLGARSVGEAVAIDEASRINVAATTGSASRPSLAVVRLKPNGKRDKSFARDGVAELDAHLGDAGSATAIAILPDGRLVVGGTGEAGFAVARLLADGRPDPSFSGDGVAAVAFATPVRLAGLAVGSDGAIMLAGSTSGVEGQGLDEIALARLSPFGELDESSSGDGLSSFRFPGTAYSNALGVAGHTDGSVLIAGSGGTGGTSDIGAARLDAGGNLDPAFSDDGSVRLTFDAFREYANDVTVDGVGRILLASCCSFGVVRLEANGDVDESFALGGGPRGYSGNSLAIALDDGGRIITIANVGGCDRYCTPFNYVLARRNEDGTNDRSFSRDGLVGQDFVRSDDRAFDVAVQPDDRIVVVGESARKVMVARHEVAKGKPDADGDGRRDRADRCRGRYSRSDDGCPSFGRSLSMRWKRAADLFTGRLRSREQGCVSRRRLELRREERGFDKILQKVATDRRGRWETDALLSAGRYYAEIEASLDPAIGRCAKARSNEITIR